MLEREAGEGDDVQPKDRLRRDVGASRYIMTLGWADDLIEGVERLAEAKETVLRGDGGS